LRRTGQVRKDRVYYTMGGEHGPEWSIPNNNFTTALHSVVERVYLVKTKTGYARCPSFLDGSERRVGKFLKELNKAALRRGKSAAISGQQFVESYSGAKRRLYERSLNDMKNGLIISKDAWVKVFTKDERRKFGGCPRAIQPRSPKYNISLGRYLKHIEHDIFDGINEVFRNLGHTHQTVAKGMNQAERGETISSMWSCFKDPVSLTLDASRWDQHMNKQLLDLEHQIYHMFSNGKCENGHSLQHLLNMQLKNKGIYVGVDGRFSYKVNGCRMSGDINTSLGNVSIMCMLMYSYFVEKQIDFRLLNDGDDCVIVVDRHDVRKVKSTIAEWFLNFGVEMVLEHVGCTIEEVEFCQAHPVKVGDKTIMVPHPGKRLYSDLVTTKNVGGQKGFNRQLGAIAGCGLACSSGMPVFQEFYKWMGTDVKTWVPETTSYYHKYRQELIKGMEHRYTRVTEESRISFFLAFDITPSEQKVLERSFRTRAAPTFSAIRECPPKYLTTLQKICPPLLDSMPISSDLC
jgi:hypothetical protein